VGLEDRGARPHHLAAFAAGVAGRADWRHAPARSGEVLAQREGPLPRHLAGGVNIKDQQVVAVAIKRTAKPVGAEGVLADRVFEQLRQSFQTCRINIGQKSAEGRAVREAVAAEQGHEGGGKGGKPFEKRLQSGLAAGGIAKQQGHKVDDVILARPSTSQPYFGTDGLEQATLGKMTSQDYHLRKPCWNGRNFLWTALYVHSRDECTHDYLLL